VTLPFPGEAGEEPPPRPVAWVGPAGGWVPGPFCDRAPGLTIPGMDVRTDAGQSSLEWLGIGVVVLALALALVGRAPGAAAAVGGGVRSLVCAVAGGTACDAAGGDADGSHRPDGAAADPRVAAAQARAAALAADADALGAAGAAALEEVAAAVAAGDLDAAEALLDRLELVRRLVGDDERGAFVADLLTVDDEAFAALVAGGTTYLEDGRFNTAYFQVEPVPGGGVVVMDFFIDSAFSGPLAGDDRGHADPFGGDLSMADSRIMLVIDLETGRGQIVQSESCFAGGGPCNEPRPIAFDGSAIVDDGGNDATGEGINLDITNQFDIGSTAEGIRIDYDALNSITPAGSIDGGVTVVVDPDGPAVGLADDDREHYPSIGTYHYPPGGGTEVIEQRGQEGVLCGAIPVINNLC
jgi:hypothetical protein